MLAEARSVASVRTPHGANAGRLPLLASRGFCWPPMRRQWRLRLQWQRCGGLREWFDQRCSVCFDDRRRTCISNVLIRQGHLAYIASHPMVGWPDAHRMRGGWLIWRASHARRVDDLACIACAAAAVGLVFGATTHLPLLADPTAVSACSTLLGPPWCGSAWCGPAWCGPAWCGC